MFRLLKALLFMLMLALPFSAQGRDQNADIYGTWKIKRFAGSADTFGLSDKQIRNLIGKSIVISADAFTFDGRACRPTYKRSKARTVAYFRREWQADAAELSLPDPVTVIETGCNWVYPINRNHIIVAEQSGVFFDAVRVKKASH
jgi:hypothetical protein